MKGEEMKSRTLCLHAALAALSAIAAGTVMAQDAESGNWLPVDAGTYSIADESNWEGGVVPTNSAATANFAPNGDVGAQNLDFPDTLNLEWNLGTVIGATNQTIRMPDRVSTWTRTRILNVANPNGFGGTWATREAHSQINLTPTGSFTPTLSTLVTTNAPYVQVQSGTAAVERLVGGGTIGKRGKGGCLLVNGVEPTDQMRTDIRIEGASGIVALNYSDYPAEVPVRGGIYVRFDASREDTLDVVEENGKRYVTAWRDAEGSSVVAVPQTGNDIYGRARSARPWLSDATSVGGHPLVDFGAAENVVTNNTETPRYGELKDTLGMSASLEFPRATQVREVFMAWQDVQDTNALPFVVGDTMYYHLHRQDHNGLFHYFENEYHQDDETYVDGVRYSFDDYNPYDCTPMTVISVTLSENPSPTVPAPQFACLNALAQDRNLRYGGVRIGEVIIYTNVLTSAERQSVHRYLQRKWASEKGGAFAVRSVRTTADGQGVSVPAGRTASIGSLDVPDNATFVKDGGGTLNVDTVARDGLSLTVNGGAVTFCRELAVADDPAPAKNPALWLDATAADSLVASSMVHGVAGRAYVGRWNDRRPAQSTICAVPMDKAVDTNLPFVVSNVANGNPAVDFGDGCNPSAINMYGDGSDAARMRIVKVDKTGKVSDYYLKAYDGFAVWRMKNDTEYYRRRYADNDGERINIDPPSLFWSQELTFTRSGTSNLMAHYVDRHSSCAHWEIDGKTVTPLLDAYDFGTEEFHVVHFSAYSPLLVNRLADDRQVVFGGQQIAEVLLYTRRLNEGERRRTIDYLTRKWRGEASASARETVTLGKVSFASGAPVEISGDRPVAIRSLDVPEGGTLTWNGGGTLSVGLNDVFEKAFYHFDATDAGSFVTDVTDNGNGTATTNVTEWLDVRRNGMTAKSLIESKSVAKPTLATVETRAGKRMPVVDFGELNDSKSPDTTSTAAGMAIMRNGAEMNAFHPNDGDQLVEEAHVVYCDAHEGMNGYGNRFIFSDRITFPFHRGEGGEMFAVLKDTYYGDPVRNGYCAVDGEEVQFNHKLTDLRFHVISAAPTSAVPIRTIAYDRGAHVGGSYQGELIAFRKRLTERQRRYVQKYLAWKWFGEGAEPVFTNSLSALRMTNGGAVSVRGATVLEVDSIDAGGSCTLTAVSVGNVSALSFGFSDASDHDSLTVNGLLTLAESGKVEVSVGAECRDVGEFPLLSATELTGGNPCGDGWTRTIGNASRRSASLVQRGNTLYLRLLPRGTVVILR